MRQFNTIKELAEYIFSTQGLSVWKKEGNVATLSNGEQIQINF